MKIFVLRNNFFRLRTCSIYKQGKRVTTKQKRTSNSKGGPCGLGGQCEQGTLNLSYFGSTPVLRFLLYSNQSSKFPRRDLMIN